MNPPPPENILTPDIEKIKNQLIIPQDVITEIFSHLPASSIGRFRSVSKKLLSDLSDPKFTKKHLKTVNKKHLIFRENNTLYTHPFHSEGKITPIRSNITPPIGTGRCYGSCNGMVLFSEVTDVDSHTVLKLLNPTTKECFRVPESGYFERSKKGKRFFGHHGLGYDQVSDDYKVLSIICDPLTQPSSRKFLVYSLRNNNWTQPEDFPYRKFQAPVPLNGCFYIAGCNQPPGLVGWEVVAMSMSDQTITKVSLPPQVRLRFVLEIVSGKLALNRHNKELWLMDDSWINIQLVNESWSEFQIYWINKASTFTMESIIIDDEDGRIGLILRNRMFSYDIQKEEISKESYYWDDTVRVCGSYTESLVSPFREKNWLYIQEHGDNLNQAVNSHFSEGDANIVHETNVAAAQDDFLDLDEPSEIATHRQPDDAVSYQSHSPLEDPEIYNALSASLKSAEQERTVHELESHAGPSETRASAQRLIRKQQDDEYLAALQADGEELLEQATREAAMEEEKKKEEEEKIKFEQEQEIERQLAAKEASLPQEPTSDNENAVTLQVRMPDGSRHGRRFLRSDTLQYLFDFIDVGRVVKPSTYRLVRSYPRRAFSDGESHLTLNELGLASKQEALFLELI